MTVEINKKPSLAIGYCPDGKMEVFAIGEASEVLEAFETENAKGEDSKYFQISFFKKLRPEKTRKPHAVETKNVNVDISQFDGREIPESIQDQIKNDPEGYQADVAAGALIPEEPPKEAEPEEEGDSEQEPELDQEPEAEEPPKKESQAEKEPKAKAEKKSTRPKSAK